jgi:hypothetical protein
MTWVDILVEKAKKRIAHEDRLIKETYCPEFQRFAKETNLFFSFGDIAHFIRVAVNYSVFMRTNGGGAGIACFEDLIKRLRLYLIAELKFVVEGKEPYQHDRGLGWNFINDFEDQFKILDRLDEELAEIRKKEGGFYQ